MEKLSRMPGRRSILILLILLALAVAEPAMAERKEEQVITPPAATVSTIIRALARQIAFVKTFSVEYPCQHEQQAANEGTGNNGKK